MVVGWLVQGFLVAGSHGFFAVYEKTDDRKDPFMLIKTLRAGAAISA